jgi:hypothetical protein
LRARPFIRADEPPRPFSEVLAERREQDPVARAIRAAMDKIAELEGAAAEEADAVKRKALLCHAEAIRCAIDESPRRR